MTQRNQSSSHQRPEPTLGHRSGLRRFAPLLGLLATLALGPTAVMPQGPLHDLGPALETGEPIDLSFEEPRSSHDIYRALERAFGVEIVLDRDLAAVPVRLELRQVGLPQALEALDQRLGVFHVVRGPRAVTVALDTPPNRKRYEPHYVAHFRIHHVDPGTAMSTLRALVDVHRIALDEAGSTLIVRGPRAMVQHAARVLEELDQPRDLVELLVEAFEVDSLERLARLDATVPTSEARDALKLADARPVLRQRSTLVAGDQGRLEAVSQPYVGRELGWEGLLLEHRVRPGDEGTLLLEARVQGACVSPTPDRSMRRDRREQTLRTRLPAGHSVLVLDPVPPAGAPVEGRGNTCGLLGQPSSERVQFVVLLSASLRPSPHRPLDAEAWIVGTEGRLEATDPLEIGSTSR